MIKFLYTSIFNYYISRIKLMPRSLRIEIPGGVYHVINRGNYRQDLFINKGIHQSFESCLFEACERSNWELEGYCVMTNHFHLVIRTLEGNLSSGMQWLQSTWASRFNRFRKSNGSLFQGRFKSLIVDEDNYLPSLLDYVNLNPVRAKICSVSDLKRYRWSSYWYLRNKKKRPSFLKCANVLYYAGKFPDSIRGYRDYSGHLELLSADTKAKKDACFDRMSKGWAIGDKDFKGKILEHVNLEHAAHGEGRIPSYEGRDIKEANQRIWEEKLFVCLENLNKNQIDIKSDLKSAKWKVLISAAMKRKTSVTNVWLSQQLNMGNPQGLSRYVREFRSVGGEEEESFMALIANIPA